MSHPDRTEPKPDLLNQLHTLRSLAQDVKAMADAQKLMVIAARCAGIATEATLAIDHYNATHPYDDGNNH